MGNERLIRESVFFPILPYKFLLQASFSSKKLGFHTLLFYLQSMGLKKNLTYYFFYLINPSKFPTWGDSVSASLGVSSFTKDVNTEKLGDNLLLYLVQVAIIEFILQLLC